ncbi:MAG: hypothetical protein ACUVQI_05835 [Thermochromatium sp.]
MQADHHAIELIVEPRLEVIANPLGRDLERLGECRGLARLDQSFEIVELGRREPILLPMAPERQTQAGWERQPKELPDQAPGWT